MINEYLIEIKPNDQFCTVEEGIIDLKKFLETTELDINLLYKRDVISSDELGVGIVEGILVGISLGVATNALYDVIKIWIKESLIGKRCKVTVKKVNPNEVTELDNSN